MVYCSGSIGCDHQLNLVPGGVAAQTVSRVGLTPPRHLQSDLPTSQRSLLTLAHRVKLTPHTILIWQTRALENLSAVLAAAGSGLEHILKANVYLANMPRDFGAMNEAYIKVGIFALCSTSTVILITTPRFITYPDTLNPYFLCAHAATSDAFFLLVAWAQPLCRR